MGEGKPDARAGFVKTAPEPKYRRVAKFLILIGSKRAAEILPQLESEQVEKISAEIASIDAISAEEGKAVLEEFRSMLSPSFGFAGGVSGGVEAARRLLYAAYGPEKGEALLVKAAPEARPNPFGFLEDFSGEQLALLFSKESPAAAAVVLSRLPPKLSADALAGFPADTRLDIVRRVARQSSVAPEVLEQIAAALKEKARHIGAASSPGPDGMNALTAILKSADAGFSDELLGTLELIDPGLGQDLKERLYTLDDLVYAANLPLQKKLASMENRDIALLLKALSLKPVEIRETLREKVLANLSEGRRFDVLDEETVMGPVPKRDAAQAATEFLAWFRQSREEGSIIMTNDRDLVV